MPYGSPVEDTPNRTYKVALNHQTLIAGDLACTLTVGGADEADTDQAIQEFLDLVDGSADFVIAEAVKTTPSSQTITAT